MATTAHSESRQDPVWKKLLVEAETAARNEPVLAKLIEDSILKSDSLETCLAHRISRKLGHHAVSEPYLHDLFEEILKTSPVIGAQARSDIAAIDARDPA